MKRIIATAAVAGFAFLVPAAAQASPTPGTASCAPLGDGSTNFTVGSEDFIGHHWAESVPIGNWYLSPGNITEINIQVPTSGEGCYQEIEDAGLTNLCLTYSGSSTGGQLRDEHCVVGQASQEWLMSENSGGTLFWLQNQYLQQQFPHQCPSSHAQFIRAQTGTASLNMACPMSNGQPWLSMQWDIRAA